MVANPEKSLTIIWIELTTYMCIYLYVYMCFICIHACTYIHIHLHSHIPLHPQLLKIFEGSSFLSLQDSLETCAMWKCSGYIPSLLWWGCWGLSYVCKMEAAWPVFFLLRGKCSRSTGTASASLVKNCLPGTLELLLSGPWVQRITLGAVFLAWWFC